MVSANATLSGTNRSCRSRSSRSASPTKVASTTSPSAKVNGPSYSTRYTTPRSRTSSSSKHRPPRRSGTGPAIPRLPRRSPALRGEHVVALAGGDHAAHGEVPQTRPQVLGVGPAVHEHLTVRGAHEHEHGAVTEVLGPHASAGDRGGHDVVEVDDIDELRRRPHGHASSTSSLSSRLRILPSGLRGSGSSRNQIRTGTLNAARRSATWARSSSSVTVVPGSA